VPGSAAELSYEQLCAVVARLQVRVEELEASNAALLAENAELRRRLGADSSNSSRPPSGDLPWEKKPAPKRSSRARSGRKPGKQPGAPGVARRLVEDPDEMVEVPAPAACRRCARSLAGVGECGRVRRQVVEPTPAPPPTVTEFQLVTKRCPCCGARNTGEPAGDPLAETAAGPGGPVRIGPAALARCVLLTCAHFLPVGRASAVLAALSGLRVSTGLVARARRRAAARLEATFVPHLQRLLATAAVLHADETTGRAAACLAYVHVACTEYLTLMHVGGRSAADIDAGGVLPAYTGVLVRDGYAGYAHLPAVHAWCGAHLLRDLRSVADADPTGQLWATAMADTLLDAHHAALTARDRGADRLDETVLSRLRSAYHGAIARGRTDNTTTHGPLADRANALISRFSRYEDMILRFATDLTIPFTNNEAERAVRPVKIQQRTSGGAWRTLQGLTDFATVRSYLDTATKWGIDALHALEQLFTTAPWLPPALTPS
jgi:transposase